MENLSHEENNWSERVYCSALCAAVTCFGMTRLELCCCCWLTWWSGVLGKGVRRELLFIPPSLSIPVFLDPTLSLHPGMAKDPRKATASWLSCCREAPAHSTSLVDEEMHCCLWRELFLREPGSIWNVFQWHMPLILRAKLFSSSE